MVINWFGGLKFAPKMKFLETELARWDYPLIPVTKEDSFSIEERNDSNTFDAQYVTEGGFLSWLYDIYPGIAIYKGEELVYEKTFSEKADPLEPLDVSFLLDKLEDDATYKAKAFVKVWDHDFVMETMTFPDDRWVDLGLPSGILWAAYNVGATSPEEYGDYYAWGEINTKNSYSAENYKYFIQWSDSEYDKIPTYKHIGENISGTSYDIAASYNNDGTTRMATISDLEELVNYCSIQRETLNSISGYRIIGPNSNSIFVPSAGSYEDDNNELLGYECYFWIGNTAGNESSYHFSMDEYEDKCIWDDECYRHLGLPVRPVKDKHVK
jgi:hypothetical protein